MTASPTQPDLGASSSTGGANAPAQPLAGTLPPGLAELPDYEIIRRLGGGGMGAVYLVLNRLMGRDEVLKIISPQVVERPEALDRFLREIRAVARLRHPNIVSAYSAFRSGASLVFAMEYVEGLDLARMVKARGPMPVGHACNYARQVALGLQHAHELGMVHRDIKPSNLMLSRDRERALIKVLDFGLAKADRENRGRDFGPIGSYGDWHAEANLALTAAGQMLGTPDFVAPEQIDDAQGADIRADIYSLGCTLYYLLSGGPPFPSETLYDVLQAHHSMDARPLHLVRSEVPGELAALVAKMMAKDPGQRFQTPIEAAQALASFSKKGEMASKSSGAEAPGVPPTTVDRPGAGAASTTTQPGTDADGPGARTPSGAEPSTLDDRRESLVASRETAQGRGASPGRHPAWVWPSVAASVLVVGLCAAWLGGILRPRAPGRMPAVGPPAPTVSAVTPPVSPPLTPPSPRPAPPGQAPRVPGARVTPPPEDASTPAIKSHPDSDFRPVKSPVVPPSPGPTPDQVLAETGLKRSGQVYVLDDTEADVARLQEVYARRQQLELQYEENRRLYAAKEAEYQRVELEIADLNQQEAALMATALPQQAGSEKADLEREEQRLMKESFDHIKDPHERERKKRERDQALEAVRSRKNSLPAQQPVSIPPIDLSGLRIGRSQLRSQLWEMWRQGQELISQNATIYQSYQALQADGQTLRDQILYRYASLNADPKVKSALRELNKDRGPGQGYVLGPIDGLPDLVTRLKRTALEILISKGLDYKKRHLRLVHRTVREVSKRKDGVDAALRRLGDGTSPLEKLREQAKRLKAELADASSAERRVPLIARIAALESQINRLVRQEGVEGGGTAPDPQGELVRGVVNLRRAVDALQAWYTDLERDAEVRKALQEVGWGSKPIPAPPELALGLKELEKAEPRVQATPVPLLKDGDRHRVDATLNGHKVASLVVDPTAETVLPARLASEAGVTVAAEEPTIVRTVDRRRVSARRAKLRSVQVGRYKATDSPCLVLLDGGAEIAPRLGRAFLDRFGGTIDEATGTLVLGELKAPAPVHDSQPRRRGDVPSHPPAR